MTMGTSIPQQTSSYLQPSELAQPSDKENTGLNPTADNSIDNDSNTRSSQNTLNRKPTGAHDTHSITQEPSSLKIGQINLRQNRTALEVLWKEAMNSDLDAILISDPPHNLRRGNNVEDFKIIAPDTEDKDKHAIILIRDHLAHCRIQSDSGRWCGVNLNVANQSQNHQLTLLSAYISPNQNEGLNEVFHKMSKCSNQRKLAILGGDFNAHSTMWSPPGQGSDQRGRFIENLVNNEDVSILNSRKSPPTYISDQGSCSWIDISMETDKALPMIRTWQVHESLIPHTDHELITFSIQLNGPVDTTKAKRQWRKVNWDHLKRDLETSLTKAGWFRIKWEYVLTARALNSLVSRLEKDILAVADRYVTASIPSNKRKNWWNNDIAAAVRNLRRLRRRWNRIKTNSPSLAESLKDQIKDLKKETQKRSMTRRHVHGKDSYKRQKPKTCGAR